MTWEETIQMIRTKSEFNVLVEKAYFDEDLALNVERFKNSEEFTETLKFIKKYAPNAKRLLDVGSGSGISAIAFSMIGYKVLATEPDPSDTVGAGAIRKLREIYQLNNLEVIEAFAENLDNQIQKFDVIYVRQAMHHAYDLPNFIKNLSNLLKEGGMLITVRDHVILNEDDKAWFLASHPLQKYYGGENAFTELEYKKAFENAELKIIHHLKYYDSVINYFPLTNADLLIEIENRKNQIYNHLKNRLGYLGKIALIIKMISNLKYKKLLELNENEIPGRMHSFIAIK